MCNDRSKHAATAARWAAVEAARPLPHRTFFAQLLAAALWRTPARAAVPVLVLSSERDALTWHACSARLAGHLRAPLRTHPTAGHDVTTDDPEWVAQRIAEWLRAGMSAAPAEQPPRPHGS